MTIRHMLMFTGSAIACPFTVCLET